MPTGYTSTIKDGISFQNFVLLCARAFGALVTMRDESFDAPIPNEFQPSDYHDKKLKKAQERLIELKTLSLKDCGEQSMVDYKKELTEYEKTVADSKTLETKYRNMLSNVDSWIPPTPDHVELKNFMRSQILQSIDFDCSLDYLEKPKLLTATKWLTHEINKSLWDIEYHTKENEEEIQRVNKRNQWIRELRKSIKVVK